MVGSMELRGRLSRLDAIGDLHTVLVLGQKRKVCQLIVEQETVHHAPRTEGEFDARCEREGIAIAVHHGDMAGAALFLRVIAAEGTGQVRRGARCNVFGRAFGIDEFVPCCEIVCVEQAASTGTATISGSAR